MKEKDDNRSEGQAQAQLDHIIELMNAIHQTAETQDVVEFDGETVSDKDLRARAFENALSVEFRGGWVTQGSTTRTADENAAYEYEEFKILLCTGGPGVQIMGELSQYGEPEHCWIEHQDWGTPWTRLQINDESKESALLEYAQMFAFND